jgi:actin-like ATPase involved in cell morphogenesis
MNRYALGIDIGAHTVTAALCGVVDGAPDGRAHPVDGVPFEHLFRELPVSQALTRVGDPTPLYGGPSPRPAVEVLADAIARVVHGVATAEGESPAHVAVVVPPSWGEHRRGELAAALAGVIGECTLTSSAVAATRHSRAVSGASGPGTVAVYDLGATTVDVSVVRATEEGTLEHAAVPPAPYPWGGRDVDDAVLEHVRAAAGLPDAPPTPAGRARSTALRAACVTAKEQLSTEPSVRVPVDGSVSGESVRLVRSDLDELIAASVAESVEVVRTAITDAGLQPADLDGLILAGGGVLVPLVAETLSAELGVALLVDARPALTVACGAAELAADLLVPVPSALPDDESDDSDDDTDDGDHQDAVLVDLGARRPVIAPQRAALRLGVVAALLGVLFVTPLSLLGVLDGTVHPRAVQAVAEAEEVPVPAPEPEAAPAAAAAEPAAAAPAPAPAAKASSRPKSQGAATPVQRRTPSGTAARPKAPAPASAAETAPAVAPAAVPPAAETPPAADTPPPVEPPASDPTPPADPPVTDPTPPADPPVADPTPSGDPVPPASAPSSTPAADPSAGTGAVA